MIRRGLAIGGLLLLLSLTASASPTGLGDAAAYNVFTFGNLSSSSDIAGRVAVGGYLQSNLLDGSNSEYSRFVSTSVFTDLAHGNGSYTVTENNGGNVYVGTAGTGHIQIQNGTGSVTTGGTNPIDFSAAKTNLSNLSLTLGALAATGTATSGSQGYTLVANSPISIFNLTADTFANLTQIITNGNTVIVNVSGTSVHSSSTALSVNGSQPTAGSSAAAGVLFNFEDATSIALNSSFGGTILAPNATLTGNSQFNGQIIVNNLNFSGEIHGTGFDGNLPTPVPEPATLLLVGSALLGVAPVVRRRLRAGRHTPPAGDVNEPPA